MFEKELKNIEEYNVLEEHHDVFKNELSINSYHGKYYFEEYYCSDETIHEDVPLDVVYKSNPTKEAIYLTYRADKGFPEYLRLNIDGRENIEVENDNSFGDECSTYYRVYYEITKEQLHKLCLANSLAVQLSNRHNSVIEECTANEFITILQALYNRAIDNGAFCDAEKKCIAFFEDQIAAKKAKDEAWEKKSALEQALDHKRKRNKTVAWVIVIIVIILVFFLVLHYYVESSTPQLYYELESKGIV